MKKSSSYLNRSVTSLRAELYAISIRENIEKILILLKKRKMKII